MVAIIDYGVGNLFSVAKAFESLGAKAIVTGNEEEIRNADKIVLPGVGAFGDCMENLGKSGLIPVIKETAASGRPFLGICVGLQILFEVSEESPKAKGLGILKGNVRRIDAPSLKIPHMGWNAVTYETKNETAAKLFAGLPQEAYFLLSVRSVFLLCPQLPRNADGGKHNCRYDGLRRQNNGGGGARQLGGRSISPGKIR